VPAPEFLQPRLLHPSPAAAAGGFTAWLEVGALVRVRVEAWQHDERLWMHWAVPCAGGVPEIDAARPFDPGRRAGRAGEPGESVRAGRAPDERAALAAATGLLAGWRPQLHRHARLGLVSRPDEPVDQFRRRCLGVLGPTIRSGRLGGPAAPAELGRLAAEIETRTLGDGEIDTESVQVRVAWYPVDEAPAAAAADLLVGGAARQRR